MTGYPGFPHICLWCEAQARKILKHHKPFQALPEEWMTPSPTEVAERAEMGLHVRKVWQSRREGEKGND